MEWRLVCGCMLIANHRTGRRRKNKGQGRRMCRAVLLLNLLLERASLRSCVAYISPLLAFSDINK